MADCVSYAQSCKRSSRTAIRAMPAPACRIARAVIPAGRRESILIFRPVSPTYLIYSLENPDETPPTPHLPGRPSGWARLPSVPALDQSATLWRGIQPDQRFRWKMSHLPWPQNFPGLGTTCAALCGNGAQTCSKRGGEDVTGFCAGELVPALGGIRTRCPRDRRAGP